MANGMRRRNFIGLTLSAPFVARMSRAQTQDRPDVLMIVVDDLNTWTGFLGGHPQARTPNMDRFADDAFVFEYGYCPAPYCRPTRVATMWGRDPAATGVYNREPKGDLLNQPTMTAMFKSAGYRTFGSGKLHHSSPPDEENWDSYYMGRPLREQWRANSQTPICNFAEFPPGPDESNDWGTLNSVEDMRDYHYVRRMEDFYAGLTSDGPPVFSALGFHEPHTPSFLPPEYWEKFEDDEIEIPSARQVMPEGIPNEARGWIQNPSSAPVLLRGLCDQPIATIGMSYMELIEKSGILTDLTRGYLASIFFLDDMVGRVLAALEVSGRMDNTIVVLWSDHGFHLGEKFHWTKFTLWEEAARVPFVMRVPEGLGRDVPTRGRSRTPVSHIDTIATLAELGCFDLVPGLDSVSVLPIMRGDDAFRPALTTWGAGNHSIRMSQWRYTEYSRGGRELYDVFADPRCETNLSEDPGMRDTTKDLATQLAARVGT